MMLNPSSSAQEIARYVTAADPVIVRRTICPELLELNRRGYLNGHTPFSAYLAFLGTTCLLLNGYSNLIVANERSSDEGNLHYRGHDINHQYSKTFEFETKFDDYLRKYLVAEARYFSLVRPLYRIADRKVIFQFSRFFPTLQKLQPESFRILVRSLPEMPIGLSDHVPLCPDHDISPNIWP